MDILLFVILLLVFVAIFGGLFVAKLIWLVLLIALAVLIYRALSSR